MGLFRRATPMDTRHLEQLDREMQALKEALDRRPVPAPEPAPPRGLDAAAIRIGQVAAQYDELDAKLAAQAEAQQTLDATLAELHTTQAELDATLAELQAKQAALDAQQSDFDRRQAELDTRMADLAARVTSVATELTNQITELGHDIDALSAAGQDRGATIDEAVLDELRDGQVRLAAEQARYQIAFRSDLAQLAERVRRPES